ncbi:UDP-glycosyltransferase [Melia azedarach]|uniref:UDP-glycosyltransferase n=1 Tax=Melia azedarach TaxID=155640 RepID=A0ACC1X7E1_MELAZ|nr:UDP-glycosyltransferase [Melia azedarach]
MPRKLEKLIDAINGREDKKMSCVIADGNMGQAIELAAKMKIRRAIVSPVSAASVALASSISLLMESSTVMHWHLNNGNQSTLWAVRPDLTNDKNDAYPEGFEERVATRSRMVGWAPQQKVLSHPSIACFLSHCRWNSTTEGVSNGIPFLCWTYFADQVLNENYICETWKVGLNFNKNESGIITIEEIKNKVEQVLGDENFKAELWN